MGKPNAPALLYTKLFVQFLYRIHTEHSRRVKEGGIYKGKYIPLPVDNLEAADPTDASTDDRRLFSIDKLFSFSLGQ